MKKIVLVIFVIIILAALGFGGWYFFLRKLPEGMVCKSTANCETGLKCANKICSSGGVGSSCEIKTDCDGNFCVNNKCTEGKKNDACLTYKDCGTGLFCKTGVCSDPPSYSQYFNKIVISKMKLGIPPGPNNMPVPTTEFKTTDALEIDFTGVKPTTTGKGYYEIIDPITGEVLFSSSGYKIEFQGRDVGTGSDLPRVVGKGEFDFNFYYNNELVYTTVITVTD
ncbi:MAG: hypothetical protein PHG23_01580 [Candidatus Pacebacteria bacterium]|nr:hypothetical protein [Candidatus Paceibacterota bacterium]